MKAIGTLKVENYWKNLELNRYGIMPAVLIIQSCYASIAVCYILALPNLQMVIPLCLVSGSTMAANAANIMLLPMKWIVGFFLTSVLFSTFTLIYSII